MDCTLRSIRVICVFILCLSFSNLLAVEKESNDRLEKIRSLILSEKESLLEADKEGSHDTYNVWKCKRSRLNNFKDKSPEERIILIYLHTLLDKILSANKQILKRFSRSASDFCISLESRTSKSFGSKGNGLIEVGIRGEQNLMMVGHSNYDSYIVATLSHELAHNLLNHKDDMCIKAREIFEKEFPKIQQELEEKLKNEDDEDFSEAIHWLLEEKWEIVRGHPDMISMNQQHEIEADNLGLKLYLNTGFDAMDYAKSYIREKYYYSYYKYYPSIPEIFRSISVDDNYIDQGQLAIQEGRFDEFMESIKYEDPRDIHLSDFWRYWNVRVQIEEYLKKHPGYYEKVRLRDSLYLKIDLSQFEQLESIRRIYSTSNIKTNDLWMMIFSAFAYRENTREIDVLAGYLHNTKIKMKRQSGDFFPIVSRNDRNETLELPSISDPMIYLLKELLEVDSQLDFDMRFKSRVRKKDIGKVNNDDILTIKANKFYRLMIALDNLSKLSGDCVSLFSSNDDDSTIQQRQTLKSRLINYIKNILNDEIFETF